MVRLSSSEVEDYCDKEWVRDGVGKDERKVKEGKLEEDGVNWKGKCVDNKGGEDDGLGKALP